MSKAENFVETVSKLRFKEYDLSCRIVDLVVANMPDEDVQAVEHALGDVGEIWKIRISRGYPSGPIFQHAALLRG